jgi:hypothetical protein
MWPRNGWGAAFLFPNGTASAVDPMTDERRNHRNNYPGSARDMRFNRASLYLAAACISAIELIEPAFSDESRAYVLKAFAEQEHAPHQRTEFVYRRENVRARYVIERVQPDRLHMIVIGPTGSQSEIYVIKDRLFQKVQGVWEQSPAPTKPGAIPSKNGIIPSTAEIFASSASHVMEREGRNVNGVEVRVFNAQISFDAPKGKTEGSMTISIDPVESLPTAISFRGQCGDVTCSYEQDFNYDMGISIEPPVRPSSDEDRARQFALQYWRVWSQGGAFPSAFFERSFADTVQFYGEDKKREAIILERAKYADRWPTRSFSVQENRLRSICDRSLRSCTVEGFLDWKVRNDVDGRQEAGTSSFTLRLEPHENSFRITDEHGDVLTKK